MSNQSHLPPRCPNSRTSSPNSVPSSSIPCKDKKTLRLYELFDDWGQSFALKSHHHAVSDLGNALEDELVELPILNLGKHDKSSHSSEVVSADTMLDSAGVYGPKSPQSKEKVSFSVAGFPNFPQIDSVQDAYGSAGEVNMEIKPFKMNSSQWSRLCKVQYISELEETVENFQNVVSELSVRVDSLVDQHGYLSVENEQLKQQLAQMQQEKLFMNSRYQSIRNEVESLKHYLDLSRNGSKARSHFRSNSDGATDKLCINPTWHMLDAGNLHIN